MKNADDAYFEGFEATPIAFYKLGKLLTALLDDYCELSETDETKVSVYDFIQYCDEILAEHPKAIEYHEQIQNAIETAKRRHASGN